MQNASKTFRVEARTPNGRWFVASRGVSAVAADALRFRYATDRDVRIVLENPGPEAKAA